MVEQSELNRLFWHSRRGMLELDVLLVPFVKEVYPSLDAENQARYPQPTTQAPGVGFPLARLVGVICLSTGALIDELSAPLKNHSNAINPNHLHSH